MFDEIKTVLKQQLALTGRELDIVSAILAGKASTKEISAFLGITESTVGKHLESLMRKSGMHSRTELISCLTNAVLTSLPKATPDNKPNQTTNRACIGVIDDDPDTIAHLRMILSKAGFDLSEIKVDDLERSLQNFDVIFVDLMMPKIDGLKIAKKIAATTTASPSVILITGYPQKVESHSNENLYSVLYKPLEATKVVQETSKAILFCRIRASICRSFEEKMD
jgi:DNA-binding NarL/FixJ family response regulator